MEYIETKNYPVSLRYKTWKIVVYDFILLQLLIRYGVGEIFYYRSSNFAILGILFWWLSCLKHEITTQVLQTCVSLRLLIM